MHLPRIAAFSLAIGLTGCATVPPPEPPKQVQPDPVNVAIAQSADLIARSVLEMKLVTTAANLPDITPNKKAQVDEMMASAPAGLLPKISTEFDGPYTTVVEAIAQAVGWEFVTEGVRPPVVQVVHKKYVMVRAIDALRDLGYTVNGATIALDPTNKRIIVRF